MTDTALMQECIGTRDGEGVSVSTSALAQFGLEECRERLEVDRYEEGFPFEVLVPGERLTYQDCYEHESLNIHRYGEYPRFVKPVRNNTPRTITVWNRQQLAEMERRFGIIIKR